MEYIRLDKGTKMELMKMLSDITNSGVHADRIISFLLRNKSILNDDEFVSFVQDLPEPRRGIYNYMLGEAKYSVNVRKTLVLLIAFILDSNVTKGAASFALGLSGYPSKTIYKIVDKERCILLDTIISPKSNSEDYLYFNKECVQNDIECRYRSERICNRSIEEINSIIEDLKNKEIIAIKNGSIKIAF